MFGSKLLSEGDVEVGYADCPAEGEEVGGEGAGYAACSACGGLVAVYLMLWWKVCGFESTGYICSFHIFGGGLLVGCVL